MAYFDGIKVGDKVYGIHGQVLIVDVVNNKLPYKWFEVAERGFDFDGRRMNNEELGRVIYWQPPPKFDPPPRPRRKVKKERWGILSSDHKKMYEIYYTMEEAKRGSVLLGNIMVRIDWEEDE